MKKIGIPYEMREGKLIMPPTAWPMRCPCCGSDNTNAHYKLEHKARDVSVTTGTTTTSTFYSLEWQVPYCENCKTHMTRIHEFTRDHHRTNNPDAYSPLDRTWGGVILGSVTLIIIGSIIIGTILYQILKKSTGRLENVQSLRTSPFCCFCYR